MENPDRGKTETDFIQFGTELILETLAEEYPNKAFKIDEVSIKSNNAYLFFVEDPMWDDRIKKLKKNISLVINDRLIQENAIKNTKLMDGDKIAFLLPFSGG